MESPYSGLSSLVFSVVRQRVGQIWFMYTNWFAIEYSSVRRIDLMYDIVELS